MTQSQILKNLPEGFSVEARDDGKYRDIELKYKITSIQEFIFVNKAVRSFCKKFKYIEYGSGTNLMTGIRDWNIVEKKFVKEYKSECKKIITLCKKYKAKYKNDFHATYELSHVIDVINNEQ